MSVAASPSSLAAAESIASLFPLPLTAMEAFMVLDSTPEYPMMCDLELTLEGRIEPAAFQQALAFALARNPLFCCTIQRLPNGALAWHPSGQLPPVQWVGLDERLDDSYGAPVDLMARPGLRIWVRRGTDESRVLLHFHHACADALGTFGFFEDFLVAYHNATPGTDHVEPRPLEPERLRGRGELGMGGRSVWRQMRDVIVGAREGLKFLLQRPAPLAAASNSTASELLRPSMTTVLLSEATSRGMRRLASQSGATTNDVLLRELFVSLARWNEAHGGLSPGRRLRILMPQNLREPDDYKMPLANAMSFAFVTRRARWCGQPRALLDSIRAETEAVRKDKLSLYFLGGLGTVRSAGLLNPLLRGPFCFATAVLSNLGDPSRRFVATLPRVGGRLQAGNLVYKCLLGVPPTRPRTHAVFTIANHGPVISVTCKWDHHRYNAAEGRRLLDDYVLQLDSTARQFEASTAAQASVRPRKPR